METRSLVGVFQTSFELRENFWTLREVNRSITHLHFPWGLSLVKDSVCSWQSQTLDPIAVHKLLRRSYAARISGQV